jgi:hypothetical protein
MKNLLKGSLLIASIAILTVGCREEDDQISKMENKTSSAGLQRSKELSKVIMNNAHKKFSSMTKSDYIQRASEIKADLEANGKLTKFQKSNEPVPLEDLFYVHEGAINAVYATLLDPEDETDIYVSYVDVEVFEENEEYFVEISDFDDFFSEVINQIGVNVNSGNGEYLTLGDLELTAIYEDYATVKITSIVAYPPPVQQFFLFPSGEVHGTSLAGWCITPPDTTLTDAAEFANSHIQPLGANTTTGSTCPNMPNRYTVNLGIFNSSLPGDAIVHGLTHANVVSKVWKDFSNSCVGDNSNPTLNNAEWTTLFNNASALTQLPISHYSTWGNAVYIQGKIESKNPNIAPTLVSTYPHYHEFLGFYGIEICI